MIQSHNTLIGRDRDLIADLAARCELWVSLTVETDMERCPDSRRTPARRLAAWKPSGSSASEASGPRPPLALCSPCPTRQEFARRLDGACDRVVIDHYLIGDGSKNGLRTRRTDFVQRLELAGFAEWTRLEKLWEVRDLMSGFGSQSRPGQLRRLQRRGRLAGRPRLRDIPGETIGRIVETQYIRTSLPSGPL